MRRALRHRVVQGHCVRGQCVRGHCVRGHCVPREVHIRKRVILTAVALTTLAVSAVLALASAKPSDAFIHEMIGASCLFGGEDVEPPGQLGMSKGDSFIRALQATGVISSIESTPTQMTINFDLSRPNAKFVSAGFALRIPHGAGPGVDLVLNPLPTIDGSTFPAFIHCANLKG
jgi:hypothetical protein